ncbi:MAG: 50S ribosomal protein L25 [Chlamydiae bacterium]|nr:50S ribosomal protein L25 [Chlamydiota bacterium]
MKLTVKQREGKTASELAQVRRAGNIPAVLYSSGEENKNIIVDGVELQTLLRKVPAGRLSTTQFVLVGGDKEVVAIVKEVQRHPTTYDILHMDFMELKKTVRVRVPIEYTGVSDCQGIKLGGFLRPIIRYVRIECAADAIPSAFHIDVRELGIGGCKRLSDITIPQGIRCLDKLSEVAIVIAKR